MTGRVLIVDDEPFVRSLIRDTLAPRGYETGLAENGVAALKALGEGDYDLVISDVVMPEMEGFELLRRLKQEHPRVKVIILTGYPRQHNISDFLLYGADEYLAKPFQVSELLAAVQKVLGNPSCGPDPSPGPARSRVAIPPRRAERSPCTPPGGERECTGGP